jgi:hypothetical protein
MPSRNCDGFGWCYLSFRASILSCILFKISGSGSGSTFCGFSRGQEPQNLCWHFLHSVPSDGFGKNMVPHSWHLWYGVAFGPNSSPGYPNGYLSFFGLRRVVSRLRLKLDMQADLRVARTVSTANMRAILALLASRHEERATFMAGPPDALSWLLVDKILAARLARTLQNIIILGVEPVVGGDGRVLSLGSQGRSPPLTAGQLLGVSSLSWITAALGATCMLAARAVLGRSEGCIALVARSVDSHADRLLHSKSVSLGRMPFALLDLQPEPLAQLPSSLLKQLSLGDLGHAFCFFGCLCCFNSLCWRRCAMSAVSDELGCRTDKRDIYRACVVCRPSPGVKK